MKIMFICGCLEPGKDGVGDYTRNMGGELIRQGHQIYLIAFYDGFIQQTQEIIQKSEGTTISVLRLERELSIIKRVSKVKNILNLFDPHWVSLQYVPSSYHPKGINMILPFIFSQLKGKFHWHIMIHEPWLVSNNRKMSRGRIIGKLQKALLKLLIYKISPKIIHTSNLFYKEILENGGVESKLLILPGNIPVEINIKQEIIREFAELGINQKLRKDWVVLGTFGRIRANIDYMALFKDLFERPAFSRKKIAFFSIGQVGIHGDAIFYRLAQNYKENILVYKFGEKSSGEISSFFQLLDYGVASVPEKLLGKSGAYSAMRIHGLKILVPEKKEGKGEIDQKNYSSYLFKLPDHEFSAERVTQQFLFSLEGNTEKLLNVYPA